jgi:hypothetical protein
MHGVQVEGELCLFFLPQKWAWHCLASPDGTSEGERVSEDIQIVCSSEPELETHFREVLLSRHGLASGTAAYIL